MVILLFFAFISGLLTILAPCIWPLLPIILSSSINKGKSKSLGITLGIMVSFAVLTLSVSYLVSLFNIDPSFIRLIAVGVLVIMGLSMISPALSRLLEGFLNKLPGKFGQLQQHNGFIGGFLTGCSLGIVWTPCTGPILATIATLAATTNLNIGIILVTVVYTVGVGIPLFFFSYGGQKLIAKTRLISRFTGRIQQIFGFIILLTALAIFTNYDKVLQVKLLDLFPSYTKSLIGLEVNPAVKKQLDILKGKKGNETDKMIGKPFNMTNSDNLPILGQAPEFIGITRWLNTDKPLTRRELKGKVVLVDFWTYTCINCIRTLPHVTAWYEKYKNQGFVVVGVHTPEFEFEKNTDNVKNAVKRFNIHYPVAQDNNYETWNAFNNQYWPAEYLIDVKGNIRRIHFGEGEYDQTELAIQTLLKEAGAQINVSLENMPDQIPKTRNSPETYLGSNRSERSESSKNPPLNYFYLNNQWVIKPEFARTKKGAILKFHFIAGHVYLVMHPNNPGDKVRIYLDDKLISVDQSGKDVVNGLVTMDKDRLYDLVDLQGKSEDHILKLEFENEGIECFAFTFG